MTKILDREGSDNPEVIKAEAEVEAELGAQIEQTEQEAKNIKQEEKQHRRLDRKIERAKKAEEVEDLNRGDIIYVTISGLRKKAKKVYSHYDDSGVYDQNGNHYSYGNIYTRKGKPLLKPK